MKRILKYQSIRIISLIISFFLFAGMYALAFSNIKRIYIMLFEDKFDLYKVLTFSTPILIVIVLNLLVGRFFCGWICTFGAINDLLYFISKKIFKNKLKIPHNFDVVLKQIKFLVLFIIIYLIWTLKLDVLSKYDPWDAFAQLEQITKAIIEYKIAFILLGIIFVGSFLFERFFCRYICPLGAIQVLMPKYTFVKIKKPSTHCGKCNLCTKSCPMGLPLSSMESIQSSECIKCLKCIDTCPRKNPKMHVGEVNIHGVLYILLAVLIFASVYFSNQWMKEFKSVITLNNEIPSEYSAIAVQIPSELLTSEIKNPDTKTDNTTSISEITKKPQSTIIPKNVKNLNIKSTQTPMLRPITKKITAQPTKSPLQTKIVNNRKYRDGAFRGIADGHKPGLVVEITIKEDKIIKINIIESNDSREYCVEAFDNIPKQIINTQSTKVDVVSGATHTSNGIMNAVIDALSKAKITNK